MTRGRLFVVPNLLGVVAPDAVLPAKTIALARRLAHYVVENAKPARAFLKSLAPLLPLQEISIVELGEAPSPSRCAELLAPTRSGHDVGLLSDAGCPGVADPGALLVAQAHRDGVTVVPLVGPSSILLALMASGMNGQGFAFHGYLPVPAGERAQAIRRIEADSQRNGYAQLFIETPYRNVTLLDALVAICKPSTLVCVAADLTTESESVVSRPTREWRREEFADYAKRPAIFLLQAEKAAADSAFRQRTAGRQLAKKR
jgi:16S rRNA (cytidine1402-2'-O)-methyltransferase